MIARLLVAGWYIGLLTLGFPPTHASQPYERRPDDRLRPAPQATTDLRPDAPPLDAALEVLFSTRRGRNIVVEPRIAIDSSHLTIDDATNVYVLDLIGEISREVALRDNVATDAFRYRFEAPADRPAPLLLAIQRQLRPGRYRMVLRLEDPVGGGAWRDERTVEVPATPTPATTPADRPVPSLADVLADADSGQTIRSALTLRLPAGEVHTGVVRIEAEATGEVQRIDFEIEGRSPITRRKPPHAIEIDLGPLPRPLALRATAYNAEGAIVARAERTINGGPHDFSVDLIEPVPGARARRGVPVVVTALPPAGIPLERVELWRSDQRVVTLFDPPYEHLVPLPEPGATTVIRARGVLADGSDSEDAVIINGPAASEIVEVDLVEIYATVSDRRDRPVAGLGAEAFTVLEDRQPQTLRRFEQVHDLPIHATILLDTSASMARQLDTARDAAARFFDQAVTSPDDAVALIAFNDRPRVIAPYTHDGRAFAEGIAKLAAARSTALYDSLVYALYYQGGLSGQRVLLVISDGEDEISRYSEEEALEYARRARVTLYTVGLDLGGEGRRTLTRLAAETGGRSFFVDDAEALGNVYQTILDELRSRYLLVYQSPGRGTGSGTGREHGFRQVEVQVNGRGLEVRALRGYYP